MSLGTVSFDLKSRPMPPGHQESQKSSETPQHQPGQGQGPQQKDQGIQPLAGEQLTSLTANYSVAPGPVWLEFVNKAAVTVAAATPVRGDLPLQGSAFLLRFLERPIVAAVLPPNEPPDQRARFGSESHEPHPPDYHWWPKYSHRPIEEAAGASEAQEQEEQRVEQMVEKEKQKEEEKKKQAEQQQQAAGEESQQQKPQPKQAIERAAAPPGRIDEWVATTGMSHQGFPGFPQPISDDTALPTTAGINRVEVDHDVDPPEIKVYMVGSGSVPAGCRWIFFTLQGV